MPCAVVDHSYWRKGHVDDEAHHEAAVDAVIDVEASRLLLAKRSGILPPRDDLDGQVERAAGEEGARLGENSQTSFSVLGLGEALGNRGPDLCRNLLKGVVRVAAADVEDGWVQAELSGMGKDFGCLLHSTRICCSFNGHAGSCSPQR